MLCYECSKVAKHREAVGLCHHCSAGLCAEHAGVVTDAITKTYPLCMSVELPQKARQLLCGTCLRALQQVRIMDLQAETSEECCTSVVA